MEWDAGFYQNQHSFVAEYGKKLFEYFPEQKGLSVLDLGCGTGTLSKGLADKGYQVLGIDASSQMVEAARKRYPGLEFKVMDACDMPWKEAFDVVFSNAVFHWIPDQPRLLHQIYQVLNKGGKLICEFGGKGNTQKIQQAFAQAMYQKGYLYSYQTVFFYPSPEQYRELLTAAGFRTEYMNCYDRPTPLNGGKEGLRNWVRQFLSAALEPLPEEEQDEILSQTQQLLFSDLWDGKQWVADYKRLQVVAQKK